MSGGVKRASPEYKKNTKQESKRNTTTPGARLAAQDAAPAAADPLLLLAEGKPLLLDALSPDDVAAALDAAYAEFGVDPEAKANDLEVLQALPPEIDRPAYVRAQADYVRRRKANAESLAGYFRRALVEGYAKRPAREQGQGAASRPKPAARVTLPDGAPLDWQACFAFFGVDLKLPWPEFCARVGEDKVWAFYRAYQKDGVTRFPDEDLPGDEGRRQATGA